MPRPTSLVEKNGSKIFCITSGAMPVPVSLTSISTYSPGWHPVLAERERLALGDIGGADDELTAIGHGVARIDREVDDHLLELMQVGLDGPEVAAAFELQLDVLAEQAAEQDRQLGQHVAELQALRPQGLLAREGEQLAHEAGSAVRVLLDVHDVLEGRIGRAVVHQQEVGEADDRRQHVVEIMRDAAGELADRLHLLALRDLHLERTLLGRVDGVGDRRLALPFGLLDGTEINAPAPLLVAREGNIDRLDQALPGNGCVERLAQSLGAVGVGEARQRHLARRDAIDGTPEQPHESGVGGADGAFTVDRGDGDRGRVEQPRESKLGGGGLLGLARARD